MATDVYAASDTSSYSVYLRSVQHIHVEILKLANHWLCCSTTHAEVLIGEQLNPRWEGTGSGNAEFADATTTIIISYSAECYRAAKLFHGEFYTF